MFLSRKATKPFGLRCAGECREDAVEHPSVFSVLKGLSFVLFIALLIVVSGNAAVSDETLDLKSLIEEALKYNRDLLAARAKWNAATERIGQATSLPDPMVMVGYQNEGWNKYTFGEMEGAQWMYSVSQMIPFPGKRGLKGEMAARDADSSRDMYRAQQLKTIATVKELYFDLFLAYKSLDLIRERTGLFSRIEEAALARYSTGMAGQQEVLMAQTEKYMILEREAMLHQKVQSLEAMLNAAVGRDVNLPISKPAELVPTLFGRSIDELQAAALANSPEIRSREKMTSAAEARVGMADKEYFPDVTLAASVFKRTGPFEDMWSVTATFNIPLYFGAKQKAAAEARSLSLGARQELEAVKLMTASGVRDNYSMIKTAERLMELYRQGLIPKTMQDFELSLTGYRAGRVEGITVASRLKALLDYELSYWTQFVEREKAIARIEALTGGAENAAENGIQ